MRRTIMRTMRQLSFLGVVVSCMLAATNARGDILFESGTLGPTGIPRSEITGGSNVSPFVFVGVRFHSDQPVLTTQVGGHFVKNAGANEPFFGAIIALANENDFPDSGNLSTPDVIGNTLLSFPEPSNEVFGVIDEPLAPGWYALVFGSGLLGASGSGVALNNGVDLGEPAYIAFQPGPGFGWSESRRLSVQLHIRRSRARCAGTGKHPNYSVRISILLIRTMAATLRAMQMFIFRCSKSYLRKTKLGETGDTHLQR